MTKKIVKSKFSSVNLTQEKYCLCHLDLKRHFFTVLPLTYLPKSDTNLLIDYYNCPFCSHQWRFPFTSQRRCWPNINRLRVWGEDCGHGQDHRLFASHLPGGSRRRWRRRRELGLTGVLPNLIRFRFLVIHLVSPPASSGQYRRESGLVNNSISFG